MSKWQWNKLKGYKYGNLFYDADKLLDRILNHIKQAENWMESYGQLPLF